MTLQTIGPGARTLYDLQRRVAAIEDALNAGPIELTLESPWQALTPDDVRIWRFGRVRILSGILKSDATGSNIAYFNEADAPEHEANGMAGVFTVAATDEQRTVRVSPVGLIYFGKLPPTAAGGRYYLPAISWIAKGA